jgi:mannose-6-phosphate isomerase-like protein (cupin superfamily)
MKATRTHLSGIIVVGLFVVVAFAQRGGAGQAQAPEQLPRIQAPTDRAVTFRAADLQERFKQMDAKKATGWRLIEGGTHNINIRIEHEDAPSVHPNTVDVWVIERGSGTFISGGEIVKDASGKTSIKGGVEQKFGVGDIIFIPAGLPHGLLPGPEITWMNIRYDMVKK